MVDAYKWSTGISKNPWIWSAWRSMVIRRSIPATLSKSATSFAPIDTRGFVLAVLTSPSEVRNYGNDTLGWCTLGSVNHQEEFHQVVWVRESGLYQEYMLSTDWFFIGNCKFAVCEMSNVHVTKFTAQAVTDFFCKVSRVCTREYLKKVMLRSL